MNGIYDIPEYEYHSDEKYFDYYNAHSLMLLLRSRRKFQQWRKEQKIPKNLSIISIETNAIRIGSASHSIILDYDIEKVIIEPGVNKRTKEGREQIQLWQEQNFQNIAVKDYELEMIHEMKKRVLEHSLACNLIYNENSLIERSIFCTDKMYEGIKLKGRPDIINLEDEYIVDYKTCQDAQTNFLYIGEKLVRLIYKIPKFEYDFWKYNYDMQAGMYIRILKNLYPDKEFKFYFIAQEKNDDMDLSIFMVHPDVIEESQKKIDAALETLFYMENMKEKTDSGYPEKIYTITLSNRNKFERG